MSHLFPSLYLLLAFIAVGQEDIIELSQNELKALLKELDKIEKATEKIGGIIGYQVKVMQLFQENKKKQVQKQVQKKLFEPPKIELSEGELLEGVKGLELCGEIYVVGGAGDRLGLVDPRRQESLPVASLNFLGQSLLAQLFRCLQGREALYYKLFGKKLLTPVALMCSDEKNNHQKILKILKNNHYFGRAKESILLFKQFSVPQISLEGKWCQKSPAELALKPGGHGVLWERCEEEGVFDFFEKQARKKLLIRQINNPIASIGKSLFQLIAYGTKENKDFGVASCERLIGAAEGMLALSEEAEEGCPPKRGIVNIEYTDFLKNGIKDEPKTPGQPYSRFPANSNILFVDIAAVRKASKANPFPGMIVNLKNKAQVIQADGSKSLQSAARLESTMQNISDHMLSTTSELNSFISFNKRRETISAVKRQGDDLLETAKSCFYDYLCNMKELLKEHCQMEIPSLPPSVTELDYLPFFFSYHPALGPLFSIIGEKLQGGMLAKGSFLSLELSEFAASQIIVDGSLSIDAKELDKGRAFLSNVKVINEGRRAKANKLWESPSIKEDCHILLLGNSEFRASNIILEGPQYFIVPDGMRLELFPAKNGFETKLSKLKTPSWSWKYKKTPQKLQLELEESLENIL